MPIDGAARHGPVPAFAAGCHGTVCTYAAVLYAARRSHGPRHGVVPPYQVAATWYGGTPHGGAHESGVQQEVPLHTRIQCRGIPLRMPVQGRGAQLVDDMVRSRSAQEILEQLDPK